MRMRFSAFSVISMAALARGSCPSAVSSLSPASASFFSPEAGWFRAASSSACVWIVTIAIVHAL